MIKENNRPIFCQADSHLIHISNCASIQCIKQYTHCSVYKETRIITQSLPGLTYAKYTPLWVGINFSNKDQISVAHSAHLGKYEAERTRLIN